MFEIGIFEKICKIAKEIIGLLISHFAICHGGLLVRRKTSTCSSTTRWWRRSRPAVLRCRRAVSTRTCTDSAASTPPSHAPASNSSSRYAPPFHRHINQAIIQSVREVVQVMTKLTSFHCRRWTRATRCLICIFVHSAVHRG